MVKKTLKKIKSVLFADPKLLFEEERDFINKSFYFEGSNDKAVVIFHGWSTTPYEVRRLGKFLNEAGYSVYGPMFSGHGTHYKDMEKFGSQDWIEDARKTVEEAGKSHKEVYVAGTSMGGNLAMILAKENPKIKGVILMATPYRVKFEKISAIAARVMSKFKKYHKKFYPPTFGVSTTITRLISYQTYPFKSVLELEKIIRESRIDLEKIHQPCFVLQSAHDHIVTKDSLEKIYAEISSTQKRKKYIQKAYHTFISDIKNEHVFEDILDFLNSIK